MSAMDRERLDILTGTAGTLLSAAEVPPAGRERLTQLDTQLLMLLRRHRLLHNAVLLIYADVAVLVLGVIAIGVAVTGNSGAAGTAALALVLAGTVTLLGRLLFAARSIMISMDAIDYEVRRALSLGSLLSLVIVSRRSQGCSRWSALGPASLDQIVTASVRALGHLAR